MIVNKPVILQERDRILAKLVALGVSEKWLASSNISKNEAGELLKGILFLREMYPNRFEEQ